MGAEKRSREHLKESPKEAASALLGLGQSEIPQKKTKLSNKTKTLAFSARVSSLALNQRQLVFNLAFAATTEVLDNMLKSAISGGISKKSNPAVIVNQATALKSLYSVVIAELGQICNVVSTPTGVLVEKMARVISEEIKRLGSTRCAVELLKLFVNQVDSAMSMSGLSLYIGSVQKSLSETFKTVRSILVEYKKNKEKKQKMASEKKDQEQSKLLSTKSLDPTTEKLLKSTLSAIIPNSATKSLINVVKPAVDTTYVVPTAEKILLQCAISAS